LLFDNSSVKYIGSIVSILYMTIYFSANLLRHFLGRALRLGQARGPSAAATG